MLYLTPGDRQWWLMCVTRMDDVLFKYFSSTEILRFMVVARMQGDFNMQRLLHRSILRESNAHESFRHIGDDAVDQMTKSGWGPRSDALGDTGNHHLGRNPIPNMPSYHNNVHQEIVNHVLSTAMASAFPSTSPSASASASVHPSSSSSSSFLSARKSAEDDTQRHRSDIATSSSDIFHSIEGSNNELSHVHLSQTSRNVNDSKRARDVALHRARHDGHLPASDEGDSAWSSNKGGEGVSRAFTGDGVHAIKQEDSSESVPSCSPALVKCAHKIKYEDISPPSQSLPSPILQSPTHDSEQINIPPSPVIVSRQVLRKSEESTSLPHNTPTSSLRFPKSPSILSGDQASKPITLSHPTSSKLALRRTESTKLDNTPSSSRAEKWLSCARSSKCSLARAPLHVGREGESRNVFDNISGTLSSSSSTDCTSSKTRTTTTKTAIGQMKARSSSKPSPKPLRSSNQFQSAPTASKKSAPTASKKSSSVQSSSAASTSTSAQTNIDGSSNVINIMSQMSDALSKKRALDENSFSICDRNKTSSNGSELKKPKVDEVLKTPSSGPPASYFHPKGKKKTYSRVKNIIDHESEPPPAKKLHFLEHDDREEQGACSEVIEPVSTEKDEEPLSPSTLLSDIITSFPPDVNPETMRLACVQCVVKGQSDRRGNCVYVGANALVQHMLDCHLQTNKVE